MKQINIWKSLVILLECKVHQKDKKEKNILTVFYVEEVKCVTYSFIDYKKSIMN